MSRSLPRELESWGARGRWVRVFGREVFVVVEGPEGATPLLVLHGFPTSSADFRAVLPALAAKHRVVVHDHLGFGLSDKPEDYSYSLVEQAEVALGVWRELGITGGHLLAHDYGTSVLTEILARRERGLAGGLGVKSVTFTNGSVHLELATPTLAQKVLKTDTFGPILARASSRAFFGRQLRAIFADPSSVSEAELDAAWAGISYGGGRARLPKIAKYNDERVRLWHRWIPPLTRLDVPAHVLWGPVDPIARREVAEQLAKEIPGAKLTWLEGVGHYPTLEAPARWSDAALSFLGSLA